MGFNIDWINLIMNCVTSASYSILVNGVPQKTFKPTRGIRQGDPLSPYLFIICAEVLSQILFKAKNCKCLTSVPFGKGSLRVNDLFFADDNLLFCQANSIEWSRIIHLLGTYEAASGQLLYKDKISIFFQLKYTQRSQIKYHSNCWCQSYWILREIPGFTNIHWG